MIPNDFHERIAPDRNCFNSLQRLHRSRASFTVDQGKLAERLPGPEDCQDGLVPGFGVDHNLNGARLEDEERISWVALVEETFTLAVGTAAGSRRDLPEAVFGHPRED